MFYGVICDGNSFEKEVNGLMGVVRVVIKSVDVVVGVGDVEGGGVDFDVVIRIKKIGRDEVCGRNVVC